MTARILFALVAAAALARPAAAQRATVLPPDLEDPVAEHPDWVGDFAVASANAVLGALTAATTRWLHGGEFRAPFTDGFLGGLVGFAGKRVAVERAPGAGFLGREIAAIGASMVANAGAGDALLDRVVLPVGPLWLTLERRDERGFHTDVHVDAAAVAAIGYAIAEDRLEFDGHGSVSAGTAVFRAPGTLFERKWQDNVRSSGIAVGGTLWLSEIERFGESYSERVFAHERIHVLQADFFAIAWGEPLQREIAARSKLLSHADRALRFGWGEVFLSTLSLFGDHGSRPWEVEANFLENR